MGGSEGLEMTADFMAVFASDKPALHSGSL